MCFFYIFLFLSRCIFCSVDVIFCSIDALFLLLSFAPRCLPSTSSYWPSTSLILSWKETIIRLRDSGEIYMVFVFNWRQMLKCIFSSWPLVLTRLQLAHLIGALKMALLLMLVISFDPWAYIGHEVTFLVIMRHSFGHSHRNVYSNFRWWVQPHKLTLGLWRIRSLPASW